MLVIAGASPLQMELADGLSVEGFDVQLCSSPVDGLATCVTWGPDLVVIDLREERNLATLRRIRAERGDVPRVLIACRPGDEGERLRAFAYGADDCVERPYSCAEVVARAAAITRRTLTKRPVFPSLRVGGLQVDHAAQQVLGDGVAIGLTRLEFALLYDLALHVGLVRTRQQLLRAIWGPEQTSTGTVTVHMRRLRNKLLDAGEPAGLIHTVWGLGYRLDRPAHPGQDANLQITDTHAPVTPHFEHASDDLAGRAVAAWSAPLASADVGLRAVPPRSARRLHVVAVTPMKTLRVPNLALLQAPECCRSRTAPCAG